MNEKEILERQIARAEKHGDVLFVNKGGTHIVVHAYEKGTRVIQDGTMVKTEFSIVENCENYMLLQNLEDLGYLYLSKKFNNSIKLSKGEKHFILEDSSVLSQETPALFTYQIPFKYRFSITAIDSALDVVIGWKNKVIAKKEHLLLLENMGNCEKFVFSGKTKEFYPVAISIVHIVNVETRLGFPQNTVLQDKNGCNLPYPEII